MPERYQADKTLVDTAYKVLERLDIRHKAGLIATGDTFMNQTDKINLVQSRFPDLIAMEMEAAAIAQVSTNIIYLLLSYVLYQTLLVRMLQCHLIILLILLLKMLPALLWKCWIICKNHATKETGGRVIFQVFLL